MSENSEWHNCHRHESHLCGVNQSVGQVGYISPERVKEYRERFEEVMAKRVRRTLNPPPRFDRLFMVDIARMNREEEYRIPPGDLYISEEVKARIREQRDQ